MSKRKRAQQAADDRRQMLADSQLARLFPDYRRTLRDAFDNDREVADCRPIKGAK